MICMAVTTARISHGIGFRQLMATVYIRFGKLFRTRFESFAEPRREARAATAKIQGKQRARRYVPFPAGSLRGPAYKKLAIANATLATENL
jgi:hypothetical protein